MRALFRPESIAVVGATDSPDKMGSLVTDRLVERFHGALHFVNPRIASLHGHKAYAHLADIPGQVDLVVAVCPADRLQQVVEACPSGKAHYLLAIPGGFGEVAGDGPQRQAQLLDAAHRCGLRVVGPNTAGVLNTAIDLNASLLPDMPEPGPGASFVSQSGGFGITVSMYSMNHQLPVGTICDLGNTVDVQIHEVLDHLAEDPHTTVVGLFLESIDDADRLRAAITALAARKPVVLTRRGESAVGPRVTRAHLGRSPGPALSLESTGVVQTATIVQLLNTVKALSWERPMAGDRVGVLTGTGGIGSELADLCLREGLDVPEFSPSLQAELGAVPGLPAFAPRNNPVDFTPIWWDFETVYPAVIRRLLDSPEVDGLLITIQDVATETPELASAVARALTERPREKPVVVFWGCKHSDLSHMRVLEAEQVPCYLTPLEAVQALAGLTAERRQ
jgi:acetate---CoA ligase (ADP-forming)